MICMNIEEIKLRTLAGLPIQVSGIEVKPLKLLEIIEYGYTKYNERLSILTLTKEQLIRPELIEHIPSEVHVGDIICLSGDEELISCFLEGLRLFITHKNIFYDREKGLHIDQHLVDAELFEELIRIIKIQNCIVTQDEDHFNPLNEQAQKIKQKMLENKKKINALKQSSTEEDVLTFSDLISIVSANVNGIHMLNVCQLNMLQFNDQFNRMKMLGEYEVNIQALLHGADSKQIELKHWMTRL